MQTRKWVKVSIIMILAMALLGAGAAWGGMFPELDKKIADAKAQGPIINKRLSKETHAIIDRYAEQAKQLRQQQDLERQMEVQAAATPAMDDDVVPAGRGFRRMLTGGAKIALTGFGSFVVGGYKGAKYISGSPLETPVSRFCRGANVALDQFFGNMGGSALEMVTPWQTATYADPSKLNPIASRTIQFGPVTQVFRTAGYTTAPVMLATCSLPAIFGVSQAGSMLIYTSSGYVVGGALNEGTNFIERHATKALFKK